MAWISEPGGRWISYTELAEMRGTDKTSALKLALRKKWPRRKDNHGTMHVCVPPEWLGAWGNRRPPDNTPNNMPSSAPNGVDISRSISTLEMALASADKRADQAEKRADRAEIRAEQAEARADQAKQAVEMERNRADRAEPGREAAQIRVDRAEQATDALRERLDANYSKHMPRPIKPARRRTKRWTPRPCSAGRRQHGRAGGDGRDSGQHGAVNEGAVIALAITRPSRGMEVLHEQIVMLQADPSAA